MHLAVLATTLLLVSGCQTEKQSQISVTNMTLATAACQPDMSRLIKTAADRTGWKLIAMSKQNYQAIRENDCQMARIAISHDKSRYYLTYLGSQNMGYDGHMIDSTYNRWVQELYREIKSQIALACPSREPIPATVPAQTATGAVAVEKTVPTPPAHVNTRQPTVEPSVFCDPSAEPAVQEEIEMSIMIETVPEEMMIIK